MPFEWFEEAVRQILSPAVLVEASLQMVLHYEQELRGLSVLLPDDGRTESTPLIERLKDLLDSQPGQSPAKRGDERGMER